MIRRSVVYLIAEDPAAHGIYETWAPVTRKVFCEERALNLKLQTEAQATGLTPDLRLRLARAEEYHGEKLARYGGDLYTVVNAYPYETQNGIDLLLERWEGGAARV